MASGTPRLVLLSGAELHQTAPGSAWQKHSCSPGESKDVLMVVAFAWIESPCHRTPPFSSHV